MFKIDPSTLDYIYVLKQLEQDYQAAHFTSNHNSFISEHGMFGELLEELREEVDSLIEKCFAFDKETMVQSLFTTRFDLQANSIQICNTLYDLINNDRFIESQEGLVLQDKITQVQSLLADHFYKLQMHFDYEPA